MKKMVGIFITIAMVITLIGCGETSTPKEHIGEAKPPSGSSDHKGADYQSVVDDFENNGFKNIKIEKLEDLITGWLTKDGEVESVSIEGNDSYSANVWYPEDVEVVITYHTFPEDNETSESPSSGSEEEEQPNSENNEADSLVALEAVFPVENAKRAAVVALTNYFAIDVFAEDGNTIDISKFHSYSDASGNFYDYYLAVESWGDWSAVNIQDWHVDNLILKNSFGNNITASLDISFDGTNYNISNITGALGNSIDLSEIENMSNSSLFLVITPNQIQDDRSNVNLDSHYSWVNSQFSSWDGSHEILKDLIIQNLNDEKSFEHIETTYQEVNSEEIKNSYNEVLKSANKDMQVAIGDLWITTQFSAKNSFNAVVKNTAYGISSFADNTVTLVAVE